MSRIDEIIDNCFKGDVFTEREVPITFDQLPDTFKRQLKIIGVRENNIIRCIADTNEAMFTGKDLDTGYFGVQIKETPAGSFLFSDIVNANRLDSGCYLYYSKSEGFWVMYSVG